MKLFYLKVAIYPEGWNLCLKGATTQFFLTVGYENAFHSDILNNAIFPSKCTILWKRSIWRKKLQHFPMLSLGPALENSSHGKNFPMHNIFILYKNGFTKFLKKLLSFCLKLQKICPPDLCSIVTEWNDIIYQNHDWSKSYLLDFIKFYPEIAHFIWKYTMHGASLAH